MVTKGGKKKKRCVRVSTRSTDRARRRNVVPRCDPLVSRTPGAGDADRLPARSSHPLAFPDQSADARAQGARPPVGTRRTQRQRRGRATASATRCRPGRAHRAAIPAPLAPPSAPPTPFPIVDSRRRASARDRPHLLTRTPPEPQAARIPGRTVKRVSPRPAATVPSPRRRPRAARPAPAPAASDPSGQTLYNRSAAAAAAAPPLRLPPSPRRRPPRRPSGAAAPPPPTSSAAGPPSHPPARQVRPAAAPRSPPPRSRPETRRRRALSARRDDSSLTRPRPSAGLAEARAGEDHPRPRGCGAPPPRPTRNSLPKPLGTAARGAGAGPTAPSRRCASRRRDRPPASPSPTSAASPPRRAPIKRRRARTEPSARAGAGPSPRAGSRSGTRSPAEVGARAPRRLEQSARRDGASGRRRYVRRRVRVPRRRVDGRVALRGRWAICPWAVSPRRRPRRAVWPCVSGGDVLPAALAAHGMPALRRAAGDFGFGGGYRRRGGARPHRPARRRRGAGRVHRHGRGRVRQRALRCAGAGRSPRFLFRMTSSRMSVPPRRAGASAGAAAAPHASPAYGAYGVPGVPNAYNYMMPPQVMPGADAYGRRIRRARGHRWANGARARAGRATTVARRVERQRNRAERDVQRQRVQRDVQRDVQRQRVQFERCDRADDCPFVRADADHGGRCPARWATRSRPCPAWVPIPCIPIRGCRPRTQPTRTCSRPITDTRRRGCTAAAGGAYGQAPSGRKPALVEATLVGTDTGTTRRARTADTEEETAAAAAAAGGGGGGRVARLYAPAPRAPRGWKRRRIRRTVRSARDSD